MCAYYVIRQYKRLACYVYGVVLIFFVVLIVIDTYTYFGRNHTMVSQSICKKLTPHLQYNSYQELYNALKQYKADAICAFKHMDITHKDAHYQVDIL